MALITQTMVATNNPATPQTFAGEPTSQLLLLVLTAAAGYRLTKKQLKKLKLKLFFKTFTYKVKNLFHFKKKKSGDPGVAILLICLAVAGVALLLGASTLTAVLFALLFGALLGAMMYSEE